MATTLTNNAHQLKIEARALPCGHAIVAEEGALAFADTREEAEQAKCAFELVLAPRFTRDEAIAIVREALEPMADDEGLSRDAVRAVRAALEALAAAGVFVDGRNMSDRLDAAGIR